MAQRLINEKGEILSTPTYIDQVYDKNGFKAIDRLTRNILYALEDGNTVDIETTGEGNKLLDVNVPDGHIDRVSIGKSLVVEDGTLNVKVADNAIYVDCNSTELMEDGTQAKPFKTIQKAIDNLAPLCRSAVINVANGTYNEDVYLKNSECSISINGTSEATKVKSMCFVNCGNLAIDKIAFIGVSEYYNASLNFTGCKSSTVSHCKFDAPVEKSGEGLRILRSMIFAYGANVINGYGRAIASYDCAKVNSYGTSGSGNAVAFFADRGDISYTGNIGADKLIEVKENGQIVNASINNAISNMSDLAKQILVSAKDTDILSLILPAGFILSYGGNGAVPEGFLPCNGASVSRATYARLFAVIGDTYGCVDGEHFNLPNSTDLFLMGSDTAGTKKEAGLPNIEGSAMFKGIETCVGTGVFADSSAQKTSWNYGHLNADVNNQGTIVIDASKSNPIYGNSTTVQPPALTTRFMVKY